MKVQSPDILVTRYGGIIPIMEELIRKGIPNLIDSAMLDMPRAKQSKYKYSDMFMSWIAASLCGATRVDNITGLQNELNVIPGLNVPSHDTIGRLMKQIVSEVEGYNRVSQEAVTYNQWDENLRLNELLIKVSKAVGALNENEDYILDVDCTFLHTQCVNAFKKPRDNRQGFNPMICLIGDLPVFVSMRNGNSGADFRQKECVEQCIDLLEKEGIKVKIVRTDGAGYREEYTKMLNDRGIQFLTASPVNASFKKMFQQFNSTNWKKVSIETATKFLDCDLAEIKYNMTNLDEKWRLIALRENNDQNKRENISKIETLEKKGILKSKQKRYSEADWNTVDGFRYKMIATNDFDTPAEELCMLYNQRGNAERKFSFLKQDFGWKYPPFMKLNENTVFLIVSAMANNIFRAMAKLFNEQIDELELNARVRRFQIAFINTVAIYENKKWKFFNDKVDFEKIC